jgi:calcineurin-like phosphoesterase family protein
MKLKLEKQNIFFISDSHFFHANVIGFDNRPFNDVNEMNETMITNWNSVVGEEDTIFYLGDLSFNRKNEANKELVHKLNGKIHFILGNHDDEKEIIKLNRFETVSDYINLKVEDDDGNNGFQNIVMMHYPILSWDKKYYGAWMLHGHCHQNLIESNPTFYENKVLDVGCNGINYTPINYFEVKEIMLNKKIN